MVGCEHGQPNFGASCVACNRERLAELVSRELGYIQSLRELEEENKRLKEEASNHSLPGWWHRVIKVQERRLKELEEALTSIEEASNHYGENPTYTEDTLRYAHKSTANLARSALLREGE